MKKETVLIIIGAIILFVAGIMFGISLRNGNNNFSLFSILLCTISVCVFGVSISLGKKKQV